MRIVAGRKRNLQSDYNSGMWFGCQAENQLLANVSTGQPTTPAPFIRVGGSARVKRARTGKSRGGDHLVYQR